MGTYGRAAPAEATLRWSALADLLAGAGVVRSPRLSGPIRNQLADLQAWEQ